MAIRGRQRWTGRAPANGGSRRAGALRASALVAAAVVAAWGSACGEDGTRPGSLRFGQVGEVQVRLNAPLAAEGGALQQVLVWSSEGAWRLTETLFYRGLIGDETVRRSRGAPGSFASAYASLITLINESAGVELFVDELSPDLDPECGPTRSRVAFTVRDARREEERTWRRCADGTLGTLTPRGAEPDAAAGRVIQAAILARDFALGEGFRSEYVGTVPFGTLDRGEDTGAELDSPRVFVGSAGNVPTGWRDFWREHTSGASDPPAVDWQREMVIVGAVGVREEAGDSVEVRRVLPVDHGTVVELYERIPGDFCTPAERSHVPFHIVVAPRAPLPIQFGNVRIELVPCGL